MSYKLKFHAIALKEWEKLDGSIKALFRKTLKERLIAPHVESSRLSSMKNCYKIKLKSAGFRLVYKVRDNELVVIVVAIGKRERNQVYKSAIRRIKN
jgi:mRNA interferase RelE/StbE